MIEKVKRILAGYTEVSKITEDSSLVADLDLSSFDLVSIVNEFEEEFDIEIPDRAIGSFIYVRDVLAYLQNYDRVN